MRVSHEIANGAEVSVPLSVPSTKNSTAVTMPELSLALAAKVTLPLTVEPFAGCVIETLGGVTSGGPPPVGKSVNSRRFGDPVPASADDARRRLGQQRLGHLRPASRSGSSAGRARPRPPRAASPSRCR